MNAHRSRTILRRQNLVPLTFTCLFLLVCVCGFVASGARPRQDGAAASAQDGREFAAEIPEHLPIRVKLRSEKSFKDLGNKGWLRELEVEVKNTGSKPIYYLIFSCGLPDVLLGGSELGFGMRYGRNELFYPETPVEPGDVPILPGESATLKASAQNVKGYEYHRDVLKEWDDPKKVVCRVQVIRFGDGTGLWGPDGKLPPPKRDSSNVVKQKEGAAGCRSSPAARTAKAPGGLLKMSDTWQPARLLRAYLLPPGEAPAPALASAPDLCGCQSVNGCMWGNVGPRNCPSCEFKPAVIFAGGCGNSGRCLPYTTRIDPCPAESDPTLMCTWDEPLPGTCYIGEPTPTPPNPGGSPTPPPPPCEGQKPAWCCECGDPPPAALLLAGCYAPPRLS